MAANVQIIMSHNLRLEDTNTREEFTGSLEGKILYVRDVLTNVQLQEIIKRHGCPAIIFGDSHSYYEWQNFYTVDYWIESQVRKFETDQIAMPTGEITTSCANFTINKKSHNRHMLLKLAEIFNLDVDYTWSGIDSMFDMSLFINEHSSINDTNVDKVWGELLSPISRFKKKWVVCDSDYDAGFAVLYKGNSASWNAGLHDIISTSAVTLIGESVYNNTSAITYSEKTAFSVYGLTMPIWVGGKYQAKYWKEKGFDTFDDIIDHSYESMPTLLERCFYAIYLNRKILTDLEYAAEVRNSVMDRLIANREKLTYKNLHKFNKEQVSKWPDEIKDIAYSLFDKYVEFKF